MRKSVVAVVAVAALLMGSAAFFAVHLQHLLTGTRAQVVSEGQFPFDFGPLAQIENAGFEPLAAPNGYTTGAVFEGKLYLAGPGGLAEFSSLDAPAKHFRTGLDLPPAPIVQITTGMLRGDARPQLILATSGEGVLWFDGRAFRRLRPRSTAARDITALLPLASGDLLIGTRQLGLLLFNGKTLTAFHPALANLNITALAGDEGDFWVGTRNHGVFHWHAGQLDPFDGPSGLPDPQVEAVALAPGKVYVGTPMGVEEFETSMGAARPARTLAPGFFARALAISGDTLTIASIDQGIREVALAPKRQPRPENEGAIEAETFFQDDGLFAVGPSGVFRKMPSGEWSRVLAAASSALADRNIAALGFAPDGRLWIGYFDHGLDILSLGDRNGDTQPAEHIEDDHVFCVNRIVADPSRNTMDIATANGLALFDTTGRERGVLLRRDGLIADQVTDVAITPNGTVLATPAGLTFIDASGTQSIYAFHGLVNNHVYTLANTQAGDGLLAGTLGGISLLDAQTVRRNLTTANSGLKHNWTTAIVPVDDSWFVGTYGAGIMKLDSAGHFTDMDGAAAPIEINPNAMLVTARHVFAGSLGNGLLVYARSGGQRWSRISAGLPSLNVTAIAEHDGEIYIGTDNGAVRIAEERMPL
jgi:hypothetical protein